MHYYYIMILKNIKQSLSIACSSLPQNLKTIRNCLGVFLALCLSACSSDINNGGPTPEPGSEELIDPAYISFSVVTTDNYSYSTRDGADDSDEENRHDSDNPDKGDLFNKGLSSEQAISTDISAKHRVLLFKDGKLVTIKPLFSTPSESLVQEDENEYTTVWQSYAIATTQQEIDQINDATNVTAFVVLNPSESVVSQLYTLNENSSYSDLYSLFLSQPGDSYDKTTGNLFYIGEDGEKYFTMTSSIILSGPDILPSAMVDDTTTGNPTLLPGSKINFWPTLEQAQQHALTLYAERIQSKFTLSFTPDLAPKHSEYLTKENNLIFSKVEFPGMTSRLNICTSYEIGSDRDQDSSTARIELRDWKVNVVGWGVNATEKSEYLFKKLSASAGYYTGWNSYINTSVRNFWGEDRNYDSGLYPDQYREAWDAVGVTPTQGAANTLNYFSFNQLSQRQVHHYSAENTWNPTTLWGEGMNDAIESKAYLRCGTHLIVTAQLLIDGFDSGFDNPQVGSNGMVAGSGISDKYYMNNIYWTEEAYMNYAIENLGYKLESNIGRCHYIPVETEDAAGLSPIEIFKPKLSEDGRGTKFFVKKGTEFVRATSEYFEIKPLNIKGGDGWVYISPLADGANEAMTVLYVLQEQDGSLNQVTDGESYYSQISFADYNALAYTYMTYMARHFKQGCMYYALPVFHNGNSSLLSSENAGNYRLSTGDMGVVRNHWYHIDVQGLNSPGCPVDNLDQLIIPNNEPDILGLKLKINVIPWHIVVQDVYF